MKRRILFSLVALALAANVFVGAAVYLYAAESGQKDSAYPSLELFSVVMEKVRREHVDGAQFTYQDLVRNALKGMLGELDPHSEFMEPTGFKELSRAWMFQASESWTPPVLWHGLLYLCQNQKGADGTPARLLCYDLRGK